MSSGWTVADTAVIHNKPRTGVGGTLPRRNGHTQVPHTAVTPTQHLQQQQPRLPSLDRQYVDDLRQGSNGDQFGPELRVGKSSSSPSATLKQRSHPSGGKNHVRWSDTFHRSRSEEELDKLLDGLDKLTETLPDLHTNNNNNNNSASAPSVPLGGVSGSSPVKTKPNSIAVRERALPQTSTPRSLSPPSVPQRRSGTRTNGQFPTPSNHSSSQQISSLSSPTQPSREVVVSAQFGKQERGKVIPNVNSDGLGGNYGGVNAFGPPNGQAVSEHIRFPPHARSNNSSALHKSVVQQQHHLVSKPSPGKPSPDHYSSSNLPLGSQLAEESDSGVVSTSNPSVRQARQLLLSRETYNPCPDDQPEMNGGTATAASGPYRQPYHTLNDSKPFSYIRSGGSSKPPSRASSREALNTMSQGLESPRLLRKLLGTGGEQEKPTSNGRGSPDEPISFQSSAPQKSQTSSVHIHIQPSERPNGGIRHPMINGTNGETSSRTIPVTHLQTPSSPHLAKAPMVSERVVPIQQSNHTQSQNGAKQDQLDSSSHFKSSAFISPTPFTHPTHDDDDDDDDYHLSSSALSDMEASISWLERQQQKLNDRRDYDRKKQSRTIHHHHHEYEATLPDGKLPLTPVRSNGFASSPGPKSETTTDGYASDLASVLYSETSSTRESSPFKPHVTINSSNPPVKPVYNVPLKVESGYYTRGGLTNNLISQNNSNSLSSYTTRVNNHQLHHHIQTTSTPRGPEQPMRGNYLFRQNSDTSFDRGRPFLSRRMRYESDSEADGPPEPQPQPHLRNGQTLGRSGNGLYASNTSLESSAFHLGGGSQMGSRPITPAFPSVPGTPYFNQSHGRSSSLHRGMTNSRAPSPGAGSLYQGESSMYGGGTISRRGSFGSVADVSVSNVRLAKDHCKYWYKPNITREEAISMLKNRSPGTFVVRDSNSFPGAFGLALKVAQPPVNANRQGSDPSSELVRHFLIEPSSKGVKLKGYNNEPVFASLSALVYQHTITPLALPISLALPQSDLISGLSGSRDSLSEQRHSSSSQMKQLLTMGAACNVIYLFTMDTDSLTGPTALKNTVSHLLLNRTKSQTTLVHFKVSGQGITLTDNTRRLFFRRHYNTPTISFCGMDPEDRCYTRKNSKGEETSHRVYGFVAKKPASKTHNQCHIFAEYESEQPARAIVNFVNKVMLNGNNSRADVV